MKNLNLQNLSRPEAFQTGISKLVRKTVLSKIHEVREPILDACCGNGIFLLEYCSSVNYYSDITGIDLDIGALETAEQLFIDNKLEAPNFQQQNVKNLNFPDESFNTIFCLNTLMNIAPFNHIEQIITEIFRLLNNNGKIFIEFRNKQNPLINYQYQKNRTQKALNVYAHRKSDFNNILTKLNVKNYQYKPIGNPIPFLAKGFLLIIEK